MATELELMDSLSGYNNRTMVNPGASMWDKFTGLFGGSTDPLAPKASFSDSLLGKVDPTTGKMSSTGWGGLALNTASAVGNAWMGMKQYGLAKDQLKFQKDAFNKNYAAQKQTMNTQLRDRQFARTMGNPNYQSVDAYMLENGIR